MKTVLAASLIAVALVGAGCKRSPSLVGKWAGTMQGMAGTFDFTAEEKATVSVTTVGGVINLLGDYKVVGDELTLNLTDAQVPGQDARATGMVKASLASVLKPKTMKITFISPDEVSFSEKAAPGTKPPSTDKKATGTTGSAAAPAAMTLKRVKEGA